MKLIEYFGKSRRKDYKFEFGGLESLVIEDDESCENLLFLPIFSVMRGPHSADSYGVVFKRLLYKSVYKQEATFYATFASLGLDYEHKRRVVHELDDNLEKFYKMQSKTDESLVDYQTAVIIYGCLLRISQNHEHDSIESHYFRAFDKKAEAMQRLVNSYDYAQAIKRFEIIRSTWRD